MTQLWNEMRLRPVLRGQSRSVALWLHICHMLFASRFDVSTAWESKQLLWNQGFSINTFTKQSPHPELFWWRVRAYGTNISPLQNQAVSQSAPGCQKPFPACFFDLFRNFRRAIFVQTLTVHPPPHNVENNYRSTTWMCFTHPLRLGHHTASCMPCKVRLVNVTSSPWTISDGAPQGYELSPLLLSLYTTSAPQETCLLNSSSFQTAQQPSASSQIMMSA